MDLAVRVALTVVVLLFVVVLVAGICWRSAQRDDVKDFWLGVGAWAMAAVVVLTSALGIGGVLYAIWTL